ncbi:alpha/beta hydrolase [Nocardioides panacisoli]|uniref:esterase/lipase family protein n=1 Tax=Nocardioides panacisoli TaxID=627624 RepID=UPI001C6381AB|nr:alpha/beta fold hydrolase [Nocardioides panacisoli]QYJ02610.1 alpha/beta hydrolase [Nocardioides panacisoli]
MADILAPFLLPEGFERPRLRALTHEGSVMCEAGRLVLHRGARKRADRRRSWAERPRPRRAEPVLLVPGFLAGDWTLRALAAELRSEGFRTYRSGILANVSCTLDAAALVEARLESIVERRDARVHVVGHSLGGMIARGVAVRRPDLVAGVVTMGSPIMAPAAHHKVLTGGVHMLATLSSVGVPGVMSRQCVGGACAEASFTEAQTPLPAGIGLTNVYSQRDGIVDWQACIDPAGEPVEVTASHIGMALDPQVARAVTAALVGAGEVSVEVDRGKTA